MWSSNISYDVSGEHEVSTSAEVKFCTVHILVGFVLEAILSQSLHILRSTHCRCKSMVVITIVFLYDKVGGLPSTVCHVSCTSTTCRIFLRLRVVVAVVRRSSYGTCAKDILRNNVESISSKRNG